MTVGELVVKLKAMNQEFEVKTGYLERGQSGFAENTIFNIEGVGANGDDVVVWFRKDSKTVTPKK